MTEKLDIAYDNNINDCDNCLFITQHSFCKPLNSFTDNNSDPNFEKSGYFLDISLLIHKWILMLLFGYLC